MFGFEKLGAALSFAGAFSSPYFPRGRHLTGVLQHVTFLGFLSIGVRLALTAGEIDI